ncbi:Phage-related minor tail protein [Paenibacillaceae bacterium GAS479]|nr:Phage-related minor tail protein [Paenibacillaceae bacterium GAS479]
MAKYINTILNLKDQFTSRMKSAADMTKQQSRQMKVLDNNISSFKDNALTSFTGVAKSAGGLVIAVTGISAAFEGVRQSMDFIGEYKSTMSTIQATTGASAEEAAKMKKQITDLYNQNLGTGWSDLTDAMVVTKQFTKQSGDALRDTTAAAVIYRDVFGSDIPESLRTADTMMKNFGISSEQSYNLMAQGSQKGLDKSGELLDTANEYAVYFKSLGFSGEQMFDVFNAGMENGAFSLDKVADSVKEFNIRSKDGSKTSAEGFKALGMDAAKMTQVFAKGGPEAKKSFDQVVQAISNVKDPVKQNAIGVSLFGTQFEDMEMKVISAMGNARKQFVSTKDTMEEVNQISFQSPSQAWKGLSRLLETSILIPIGDKILPKLNEFANWFKSKTPQIKTAIDQAFVAGAKVIDGFKQSLAWAKDNAEWLVPAVTGLTAAIAAQQVVGLVSKTYQAWTTATKGLTLAQIALNIVTKASPFGWIATIIGLVIGAGVLLYRNWDTVKLKASELWAWLGKVWTNLKEGTINTFNGVADKIKGVFTSIVGFIRTPINTVIGIINGLIDKINGISIDIPDWVPGGLGGKTFGLDIPKIPEFALGTSYAPGGLARINERGGEVVNLPNGSQVIPADKSEKMISNQNNGVTVNLTINGNVYGEEDLMNRVGNLLVKQIKLAHSNM